MRRRHGFPARCASVGQKELWVNGGKEHLVIAVRSILDDAIKDSTKTLVINVKMSAEENSVTIAITDSGVGSSERDPERLSSAFEVGDIDHHTEGNGIGLALAQASINFHGGSISAESIPGVRTSFYITLPAADVQSKTPAVFPVHSER